MAYLLAFIVHAYFWVGEKKLPLNTALRACESPYNITLLYGYSHNLDNVFVYVIVIRCINKE